jgi:tmRNA-binding protein
MLLQLIALTVFFLTCVSCHVEVLTLTKNKLDKREREREKESENDVSLHI